MLFRKKKGKIVIDDDRCMLCGTCEAVCPEIAVLLKPTHVEINHEKCSGCGLCIPACPTEALR